MRLANDKAAIALTMLNKCCDDVEPAGPWRWRCSMQNGTRVTSVATFSGDFLRLAVRVPSVVPTPQSIENALISNAHMRGGARIAHDSDRREFLLSADMAVLTESQVAARVSSAMDGFHDALSALEAGLCTPLQPESIPATRPTTKLASLLEETRWQYHVREEGDYAVTLDAGSSPPARLTACANELSATVELVRVGHDSNDVRQALANYLLSASGTMRMVRASMECASAQCCYQLEARLPADPEPEELDHTLRALSIAYRGCAGESTVLLNEAAARCYLTVHDKSIQKQQTREEN